MTKSKNLIFIITVIASLLLSACAAHDPWQSATYLEDTELGEGAKLALVLVPREDGYSFALSSQTEDVRLITKELCSAFGGKGGGPKDMTQGVLTSGTEAEIREKLNSL